MRVRSLLLPLAMVAVASPAAAASPAPSGSPSAEDVPRLVEQRAIEVEDALYKHPAVAVAAVVAAPDEKWGEVPWAFVELKPDALATEAELIAHARNFLAGFKVPKRILFQEVPKTSTGKLQKVPLRKAVREGLVAG